MLCLSHVANHEKAAIGSDVVVWLGRRTRPSGRSRSSLPRSSPSRTSLLRCGSCPQPGRRRLLLFFTLNREDFSFVIHLDRQPRTSRRREAQTGSRARSGSRSERTLDAVEHSRTLMEWWPFLIFHRGGLRIKLKFPGRKDKNLNRFK